jgi:hypothetical protein
MRALRAWIESHKTLTILACGCLLAAVAMAARSEPTAATEDSETARTPSPEDTLSAADASAQFKDLMDTAEEADLISSYQFSETGRVIYVTGVWYSQTVGFKKDFLAKVAMLQEAITGHHYFGVRNDQSNEKVGEVTAFSGSIEVYW